LLFALLYGGGLFRRRHTIKYENWYDIVCAENGRHQIHVLDQLVFAQEPINVDTGVDRDFGTSKFLDVDFLYSSRFVACVDDVFIQIFYSH
jgi:hypothetical protein